MGLWFSLYPYNLLARQAYNLLTINFRKRKLNYLYKSSTEISRGPNS